jgi:integrase
MATTYDVRIWKIKTYKGRRGTTYTVRWLVVNKEFPSTYTTFAAADAFRSELLTAQRKGEAFDTETGRPVSWARREAVRNWYDFACEFVDKKWPHVSPHHRKNTAETLMLVTMALLKSKPERPKQVRKALRNYAFNSADRTGAPADVALVLAWVRRNSPNADVWEKETTVSRVFDALSLNLDGTAASASSLYRHRAVLYNALSYAAKDKTISGNPLAEFKIRKDKAKATTTVDRRSLVNPMQAQKLLASVRKRRRNGAALHAFFATLYYAGLRPEEAAQLHVEDLTLPPADEPEAWGELVFSNSPPEIDKQWTDSGQRHERRGLKGRAEGESRRVPVHPTLVRILREHIGTPNPARRPPRAALKPGERLFSGDRGGYLASVTYRRAWSDARDDALEPYEITSLLGKTPYDLRHTCLTTWLNAGVPAAQVATWAGNSVRILLATYINCIDGGDDDLKRKIRNALPE